MSAQRKGEIGAQRMKVLLVLSEQSVREGRPDRARRYADLARRIGMKTRTRMPDDVRICKGCLLPMMPGVNCRVRMGKHHITACCTECGRIYRRPYLKEQRE
jgi:ribonuclease P protein subunit RPR2